jgi:hypothetical protein
MTPALVVTQPKSRRRFGVRPRPSVSMSDEVELVRIVGPFSDDDLECDSSAAIDLGDHRPDLERVVDVSDEQLRDLKHDLFGRALEAGVTPSVVALLGDRDHLRRPLLLVDVQQAGAGDWRRVRDRGQRRIASVSGRQSLRQSVAGRDGRRPRLARAVLDAAPILRPAHARTSQQSNLGWLVLARCS